MLQCVVVLTRKCLVLIWCSVPSFANVLLLHDMIPEVLGWDLSQPEWAAKQLALDA